MFKFLLIREVSEIFGRILTCHLCIAKVVSWALLANCNVNALLKIGVIGDLVTKRIGRLKSFFRYALGKMWRMSPIVFMTSKTFTLLEKSILSVLLI